MRSRAGSALLGLTIAASGVAVPAVAAPGTPTPDPGPAHAPVQVIVAPVVDIHFASQDLAGVVVVEDTPAGTRFRLDSTVLFGKDSAVLRPAASAELNRVAKAIRTKNGDKGVKVAITGYTDDLGPAAHGLKLSRQRAAEVGQKLKPLLPGTAYTVTTRGRGEADPAAPNSSETNRRKNRRVVITVDAK